ncbi:hypothetical protein TNIN_27651 [Trichonephila inaurata madagascariensis]|uniref:Uncharacterized protein n=1 Tax=Trichonephila inaurata madagascariensis TaxID=2747483 RepID=A0A8X6YD79_9ARAC|nr:hypothetical protein TNIN_27651 [Trichonephila inaurata madagascariensis]
MKPGRVLIIVVGGVFIIITPQDKRERDRFLPVRYCAAAFSTNRRLLGDCSEVVPFLRRRVMHRSCNLVLIKPVERFLRGSVKDRHLFVEKLRKRYEDRKLDPGMRRMNVLSLRLAFIFICTPNILSEPPICFKKLIFFYSIINILSV